MSEESDDGRCVPIHTTSLTEYSLSSALLGVSQNLVDYHPSHNDAMKLWVVHVQNVEPVCKVLHIPTTARMVEQVSQQPANASKSHECLLFAIYYFAVFSMTDEDCLREFGQSQATLMSQYQDAVRQALINASWLRTTEMSVMQAFVLFLIAVRTQIDPHTFWILTGVAVRIAQRMGLHRDGESLALPPFEVEIRRRLFWQLLPLDGFAGGVSTGISTAPNDWDTKQPLNINDDQIYPGITQQPEGRKGATEMMYCLARSELSKLYTRTGVKIKDVGAVLQFKDRAELEKVIDEVEDIIESKYLRY
jgi:Fungal specific transcription factor domain